MRVFVTHYIVGLFLISLILRIHILKCIHLYKVLCITVGAIGKDKDFCIKKLLTMRKRLLDSAVVTDKSV